MRYLGSRRSASLGRHLLQATILGMMDQCRRGVAVEAPAASAANSLLGFLGESSGPRLTSHAYH